MKIVSLALTGFLPIVSGPVASAVPKRKPWLLPGSMLSAAWNIPLGGGKWSFEGYLNQIAAKGTNEFGGPTAPETNLDVQLMYDFSPAVDFKPKTLKAGCGHRDVPSADSHTLGPCRGRSIF